MPLQATTGSEGALRHGVVLPSWANRPRKTTTTSADDSQDVIFAWHEYRWARLFDDTNSDRKLSALVDLFRHRPALIAALMASFDPHHNLVLDTLAAHEMYLHCPSKALPAVSRATDDVFSLVKLAADFFTITDTTNTAWLGGDTGLILALTMTWAPIKVRASVGQLLWRRLDPTTLQAHIRFVSLANRHESCAATVALMVAGIDNTLPGHDWVSGFYQTCAGTRLIDHRIDMCDGENGGKDEALVLKRLQFHAGVKHFCIGSKALWNVCIAMLELDKSLIFKLNF